MSIPERMIVSATVKSRAEEESGYVLELEIPQFKSDYPTKVTRVKEAVAKLLPPQAEPYNIVLLRENLKKNKEGTRFYDYYWGLEGLATAQEKAAKAQEPEPVDTRRLEIAWGQAINCAVARMGIGPFDGAYLGTVEMSANLIYPLILKGPKHAQARPQAQQGEAPTPSAVSTTSTAATYSDVIPESIGELLTRATTPTTKSGGLGYKNRTEVFDKLGIQSAIEIASLSDAWIKLTE